MRQLATLFLLLAGYCAILYGVARLTGEHIVVYSIGGGLALISVALLLALGEVSDRLDEIDS